MLSAPFARARAMMSLIVAAMGDMAKLAAIGPYESRGKGKGRGPRMCRTNFLSSAGSKYMPHQGKRECARRIRQMEAA